MTYNLPAKLRSSFLLATIAVAASLGVATWFDAGDTTIFAIMSCYAAIIVFCGATAIAALIFRLASLTRRRIARRMAPIDPRPRRGEFGLHLGSALNGREVWIGEQRIRRHLLATGPRAAQSALFCYLKAQVAAAGCGSISLAPDETSASAFLPASFAGRGDDVSFVDLSSSAQTTASNMLSPFLSLDADAILRIIFFACPELSGSSPTAMRAAALLQALIPILVHLDDEGFIDFSPAFLPGHLRYRYVCEFTDHDRHPDLPPQLRAPLKNYLASMPGYDQSKGERQAIAVLQLHSEAATMAEGAMRPFLTNPNISYPAGDFQKGSLISDRRLVTIRLPQSTSPLSSDGVLTRFIVGWLIEEIKMSTPGRSRGNPFAIFVDGLPDAVRADLETFIAGSDADIFLVAGSDDRQTAFHSRTDATYATRLLLPGLSTKLSGVPDADMATLSTAAEHGAGSCHASLDGHLRRCAFHPVLADIDIPPRDVDHRVTVLRPNIVDVRTEETLPLVAERLADHRFARSVEEMAQSSRHVIEIAAATDLPLESLETAIDASAVCFVRAMDATQNDYLTSSCLAIASLADPANGNRFLVPAPRTPTMPTTRDHSETMPKKSIDAASAAADSEYDEFESMPDPGGDSTNDLSLDFDMDFDDGASSDEAPTQQRRSSVETNAVVIPNTTAPTIHDQGLAGVPLQSVSLASPEHAANFIAAKAPHLADVARRILTEISSHAYIRFRPVLLVGPPGSGKSRFARLLCEALGLHSIRYACGGIADSSFAGTSRQWHTARPSVPLQAIMSSKTSNPCIILDEISRAGTGSHNGNFIDALLDFTEPGSARRYLDPGLEIHVDLSRVLWVATCNDIMAMPQVLLDRFRKIDIPPPSIEHAPALIREIAAEIAEDNGFDRRFAYVYSDHEIDMIAGAWGGGSLRKLRSLMEKVTAAIDNIDPEKLN